MESHTTKNDSQRIAIISNGHSYTYKQLLESSKEFASLLLAGSNDLHQARVAFMVEPGFDYVKVQWGIWRAGGVAVPLALSHPLPALTYTLMDAQANTIVVSETFRVLLEPLAKELNIKLIVLGDERTNAVKLPEVDRSRAAMIIYTSGTTSLPKGVLITHANIEAQVATLVKAWQWQESDHILCVLPLHHVHGIINVVTCALWSGACCEFLPEFSAEKLFDIFLQGRVNVFMAVPTIYFKLIACYETLPKDKQKLLTAGMKTFRLMVSGSAALPVSIMQKWEKISGHRLLERYGMTEIGMALSNPYAGQRRAGYVGLPLPGVEVRLVNEHCQDVVSEAGEILVKGENVFKEYWNKPQETREAFVDGWFRTGDLAVVEDGYYRILGRNSTDIIKSGGYKISALEIEEVLRSHSDVSDCAAVGLEDDEWGEVVAVALTIKQNIDIETLKQWLKEKLPAYKVPRKYKVLSELPRNTMGKVIKSEVKTLLH
jgi:malonyl-CoA/methylmalonyl-CoA synthetase